ncbi:uncharacterized protein LOC134221739 [Armigeres subalbatus]|uniref:uncharacterized protein LOC134221739 n=1 Tax=Armigeres subalbatus TaxID=124917 RepID=UPI002ED1F773
MFQEAEEVEVEKRRIVTTVMTTSEGTFIDEYVAKFSNYSKLIRSTAVWQRLIKLLNMPKEHRKGGFFTTEELSKAEHTLVRLVQKVTLSDECKALSEGIPVSRKSQLRWFHPYMSHEGMIRLGGRLRHSSESEDFKHPIVLPKGHQLTRLLFEDYHKRLLQAGPQLLLSTVRFNCSAIRRNEYRTASGSSLVQVFPSKVTQFMGELLAERVTVAHPFSRTGIDFFGPVPGPRQTAVKTYGAIFVCMAIEADLELVSDLSTNRFIQALRRFVARRGRCSEIFSDSGTNFGTGFRNYYEC